MNNLNHEIEVKLKVKEQSFLPELSKRIRESKLISHPHTIKRREMNLIFDTPRGKLKDKKQVLRLRTISPIPNKEDEGYAELTFKDKGIRIEGISSRPETNIRISSNEAQSMQSILFELGYKHSFAYAKIRTTFQIPDLNAVVEYDELPYIGDYIEIEAPNNKTIEHIIKALNLEDLKRADGSYIKILKDELKKQKIKSIYAEFEAA